MKRFLIMAAALFLCSCAAETVRLTLPEELTPQTAFSAEQLTAALEANGYEVVTDGEADHTISLSLRAGENLKKEGFRIETTEQQIAVMGNDENGLLYGCR
ncbi:MAG: hypothetical protein IIU62_00285, partial [Alistipes sp.]|nr:hypothetical protein [Alistipes sp.]